jgi:hypothetical protein
MDIGTTQDFIHDLQEENARLHQAIANLCNEMVVLESELQELERIVLRLKNEN